MINVNQTTPKKTFAIIVTYNGEKWIEQCLESLQNSSTPVSIVVIDNHSNDNTLNILRKNKAIHLIEENKNHGFGIANNLGISYALNNHAQYVFLLNQDAFIQKDTIKNLIQAAEENNVYGLYSPIHLNESGDNFDDDYLKNYIIDGAPQYLSDVCIKKEAKSTYPIYSTNAAAWFIRSETFKVAGGFDPIFFMYGEDNDFSHRLEYHQIKRAIVTNSFIHHSRGKNPSKNTNALKSILSRAKRIQANTLAKIKNPNKKFSSSIISCFTSLFFASINELIYCLNIKEFLAHILAIIRLTFSLKKIARHRKICMKRKHPWLHIENTKT